MKLKLKARVKYLASIFAGNGTAIRKDGLAAYVDLDYSKFANLPTFDPTQQIIVIYEPATGLYKQITLAAIVNITNTQQVKTTSGSVTVQPNDGVIVINKASGAATTVNLPLAVTKIGPVLITDLKGDAGTNNITITPTAPETIQGQATFTIAANGASMFLRPVPGIGYVI